MGKFMRPIPTTAALTSLGRMGHSAIVLPESSAHFSIVITCILYRHWTHHDRGWLSPSSVCVLVSCMKYCASSQSPSSCYDEIPEINNCKDNQEANRWQGATMPFVDMSPMTFTFSTRPQLQKTATPVNIAIAWQSNMWSSENISDLNYNKYTVYW